MSSKYKVSELTKNKLTVDYRYDIKPMVYYQVNNALRRFVRRTFFATSLRKVRDRGVLFRAIEIGRNLGWDHAAVWILNEEGKSILIDKKLHAALENTINENVEKEFLLTAIRKQLLLNVNDKLDDPVVQRFSCALLRQCMNNGYVWFISGQESKIISQMRRNESSRNWKEAIILAMYMYFPEFLDGNQLHDDSAAWLDGLPSTIAETIKLYLNEMREEETLQTSIEAIGSIKRDTSKKVGKFYENSPYPRWVQLDRPVPGQRKILLKRFFNTQDLAFLDRPFAILVAGCGTGNKAISYALDYGENATVWAVDLSRASLAYAKRMALQNRVKNIHFLQMDLLDLPMLCEKFDVVECTGVLHHLSDPVEGGKAIISSLKPGGIAHISLYSELARREIVWFQQQFERDLWGGTFDDVRRQRRKLMLSDPHLIDNRPVFQRDFFSLNSCKDLLFHPLEHRYTIPKIENYIKALDLEFRGLYRPGVVRSKYFTIYPRHKHRRSYKHWQRFEEANPDAFWGLYQIWSKKLPAHS